MKPDIEVRALKGRALIDALEDLARLRITVFRDYPYLYDGDLDYEKRYLQHYQSSGAIVVGAYADGELVGAATGSLMQDHADEFGQPFVERGYDLDDIFYCGESVLLRPFRGYGIGYRFFDHREAHARQLGKRFVAFCGVVRPDDHPLKPAGYRPLDAFWKRRGYLPLPGVLAHFSWKDIDQPEETEKPLQFWFKSLEDEG